MVILDENFILDFYDLLTKKNWKDNFILDFHGTYFFGGKVAAPMIPDLTLLTLPLTDCKSGIQNLL